MPALKLGPIAVDPPVVLAPMAGVTNVPFRNLCRRYGAGLYVSEMITARALVEGNAKTLAMAAFDPDESVRSVQLCGVDPGVMGAAVRRLVTEIGVDHIDLNFGCPAGKVTRQGGGAALPVHRELFRAIVSAAVGSAGSVPVTVKMRIGLDDDHITFTESGRIAEGEGVAAVTLHARTAEQLYSGSADWRAIAELKAALTSIPVLGNGDLCDDDALMCELRLAQSILLENRPNGSLRGGKVRGIGAKRDVVMQPASTWTAIDSGRVWPSRKRPPIRAAPTRRPSRS